MSNEEEKIVDELDREFSRKEGLVALAVCFALGGWMMVVAAINVITAV